MEAARLTRRSAKGKLTRTIRTVISLIEDKRTDGEITRALELMRVAYTELSKKHESYCELLSDDVIYDEAEDWMDECRVTVVSTEVAIAEYLGTDPGKGDLPVVVDSSKRDEQSIRHITQSTMQSGSQDLADKNMPHAGNVSRHTENLLGISELEGQLMHPTPQANRNTGVQGNSTSKLKKDFIPKFDGNVRDYGIFRADFKHIVEKTCDDRDAITVLRSSVSGKPAELIRGITNDYKAAWEYLDSVYGDPRYVSDAVTHDIASFPCLRDGEDVRFCDFVHLLRRSYSTLKELERPEDMNNNHMIALVEQKLCNEDRKVWARHLVQQDRRATFEHLLRWMKTEMEARMRSSAPLRTAVQSDNVICNTVSSDYTRSTSTYGYTRDTCWICRSCDHWVDQCEVLRRMSPHERLQKIQDNHACLCCMKLANRNHTPETCYRRRECSVMSGGEPCNMYHHPLLHGPVNTCSSVGIAALETNTAILPVLSVRALGTQARSIVANTLLDSGAQVSLIRTEVATKLGLKGRQLNISLKKVGGHTEEIETKEYTVKLQSLETRKTYDVNVIAIPCISEDVCEVTRLHRMAEQLKISGAHINRETGPIDILIGIDHAHLHVGETRQGAGGVVARHSPLGWIIFGSSTRGQSVNAVVHVGVNTQPGVVDIPLSKSVGSPREHSRVENGLNRKEYQEDKKDIKNDLPGKKQHVSVYAVEICEVALIKVDDMRQASDGIDAKNCITNGNKNNSEVNTTQGQCVTDSVTKVNMKATDYVTLANDALRELNPAEYQVEENCSLTVQLTESWPKATDTPINTDTDVECQCVRNTITGSRPTWDASFSVVKSLVFVGTIMICITATITCTMKRCVYGKSEEIIFVNGSHVIGIKQCCPLVLACDSCYMHHRICAHRKQLKLFATGIAQYRNRYFESTTIVSQPTVEPAVSESNVIYQTSLVHMESNGTIFATTIGYSKCDDVLRNGYTYHRMNVYGMFYLPVLLSDSNVLCRPGEWFSEINPVSKDTCDGENDIIKNAMRKVKSKTQE